MRACWSPYRAPQGEANVPPLSLAIALKNEALAGELLLRGASRSETARFGYLNEVRTQRRRLDCGSL